MKDDIKDYLTSKGVEWEEASDLRVGGQIPGAKGGRVVGRA